MKWGWDYNRELREDDIHVPGRKRGRRGRVCGVHKHRIHIEQLVQSTHVPNDLPQLTQRCGGGKEQGVRRVLPRRVSRDRHRAAIRSRRTAQ